MDTTSLHYAEQNRTACQNALTTMSYDTATAYEKIEEVLRWYSGTVFGTTSDIMRAMRSIQDELSDISYHRRTALEDEIVRCEDIIYAVEKPDGPVVL